MARRRRPSRSTPFRALPLFPAAVLMMSPQALTRAYAFLSGRIPAPCGCRAAGQVGRPGLPRKRRGASLTTSCNSAQPQGTAVGLSGGGGPSPDQPRRRKPNLKIPLEIPETEWPSYPNFAFEVLHHDRHGTAARTGRITTPHGDVETPAFIFCATKAAMKGLSMETMKACGTQILLSNTYHLLVHPGSPLIQEMGGLQKATRWEGPMLTDSGGYQIFSMGHGSVSNEIKGRRGAQGGLDWEPSLLTISEKGARFKSYHDSSIQTLTPESSIVVQRELGADLVVVLDECTPFHVDKEYTAGSMRRSHRWALRSLAEFIRGDDGRQALYGIVQGGVYPDLRQEAVDFMNHHPFFGIAIGGSLGADKGTMHAVVTSTMAGVRRDRPVHLLGIGGVADIFHGVRQGIDTFDCVHPTRLGRHGGALVKAAHWEEWEEEEDEKEEDGVEDAAAAAAAATGRHSGRGHGRGAGGARPEPREHVNLSKGRFRHDHQPIDARCGCPTCRGGYTRAYLHHLLKAGELVGGSLIAAHNVFFMNELMAGVRRAVHEGTLDEEEAVWLVPELRPGAFAPRGGAAGEKGPESDAAAPAVVAAAAGGGPGAGGGLSSRSSPPSAAAQQ